MKALILSAGYGTRMAPITDVIPKPLIPVLNTSVIEYNIRFLRHFGIRDIFINLHHKGSKIIDALGDGSSLDVNITYLHEEGILGTGGAVGQLRDLVKETFIVLNADTIFDFDLRTILDFHRTSSAPVTLGLLQVPCDHPQAHITVDDDRRITRILDASIYSPPETGNTLFTGLHVIEPELFEYIPRNIFVSISTEVYCRLIEQREQINGFIIDGRWWDMGTPSNYIACNFEMFDAVPLSYFNPIEKFRHHSISSGNSDKKQIVVMGGDVQIPALPVHSPVMIGNNVKINGGKSLGPKLIVGDGARISGKKQSSNAIYLGKSRGRNVLTADDGVIYY